MRKKLIHIVGGGFNQVPLVKKALSKNLSVLVTDSNDNPPAREFASFFEKVDTTAREDTLAVTTRYRADFVLTDMTDVAVPTVAYIAEKLSLPGIGYETSLRFTNKYVMRKALVADLRQHIPESRYFENPQDAIEGLKSLDSSKKYVVKPINSQGSKGVEVLSPIASEARRMIIDAAAESRDRGVLIEDFVEGFEYSVESFVKAGEVHNLTLTKKFHYKDNPCLDVRNTFLGDVSEDLEQALFAVNRSIIKSLGLSFGLTHAEYKIDNDKIYLIEIAARGAGGSISSHIVPYLTGFDTLGSLIDLHTGQSFDLQIADYKKKFAVLKFFDFLPGTLKKVLINKAILEQSLVHTLDIKPGDTLRVPRDSRDRCGYFVVHGEDREQVLKKEKLLDSCVQVEYA